MATVIEQLQEYARVIDEETNEIAATLESLKAQIEENNITPEQVVEILGGSIANLQAVGSPATLPPQTEETQTV